MCVCVFDHKFDYRMVPLYMIFPFLMFPQTEEGGTIVLTTDTEPREINVHYAHTIDGNKRYFKLLSLDFQI